MSTIDFRSRRADINKARKLVAEIVSVHLINVRFSRHALEEMKKDNLTTVDIENILKSPASRILKNGEFKDGSYRYQFGTSKIVVVIAFWTNGDGLNIVSAWRK